MAVSNLTRNLRDGTLTISDGSGSPKTLEVILDEGDLEWTETDNTIAIMDRGSLSASAAHTRPGDDVECSISFSAKWTQLLGVTATSSDGSYLYEMLNNLESYYTSTSGTGQQFTLSFSFVVTSPSGSGSETILFNKVYKESLSCSEGNESNMIKFSGKHFGRRPTVSRS